MRLDKLTLKLQEALQDAISFATESGHQRLEPEHLFYTLLRQEDSIIVAVLDKLGIPTFSIIRIIEEDLHNKPSVRGSNTGERYGVSNGVDKVVIYVKIKFQNFLWYRKV